MLDYTRLERFAKGWTIELFGPIHKLRSYVWNTATGVVESETFMLGLHWVSTIWYSRSFEKTTTLSIDVTGLFLYEGCSYTIMFFNFLTKLCGCCGGGAFFLPLCNVFLVFAVAVLKPSDFGLLVFLLSFGQPSFPRMFRPIERAPIHFCLELCCAQSLNGSWLLFFLLLVIDHGF